MTPAEVRSAVIAELRSIQEARGLKVPKFTDSMRPIGDLEDFDSYLAEDATGNILLVLKGPAKMKSPFKMKDAGHTFTLRQVVGEFCRALQIEEI